MLLFYAYMLRVFDGITELTQYTLTRPNLDPYSIIYRVLEAIEQNRDNLKTEEIEVIQFTNLFFPWLSFWPGTDFITEILEVSINTILTENRSGVKVKISQQKIDGFPTLTYEVNIFRISDNFDTEIYKEI